MAFRTYRLFWGAGGTAGLLLALAPARLQAQEALNAALENAQRAQARTEEFKEPNYNLKLGPVGFLVRASMSLIYNDNILNRHTDVSSDFIFQPGVDFRGQWQVTELNKLTLGIGLRYLKHVDHTELDRFSIVPDADNHIAYDFFVGPVRINVHDAFYFSQDAYREGQASGVGNLGVLRNTIGASLTWQAWENITFNLGYDHANSIYSSKDFSSSDHSSDSIFWRGSYQVDPTLQAGLEASVNFVEYSQRVRNNHRTFSIGPFANWQITESLGVEARVGYTMTEFTSIGTIGDTSKPDGVYGTLTVEHVASQSFRHGITGGQQSTQGIGTTGNFLETTFVRYHATYQMFERATVTGIVGYEHSTDTRRLTPQDFSRYSIGLSTSYQVGEKIFTSLSYQHYTKDASIETRSYDANIITVNVSYRF